jgi:hypothetical protein
VGSAPSFEKAVSQFNNDWAAPGTRPDFGALQIREALIPAVEAKEDEIIEAIDHMLGHVAGGFNHRWM